jgi:hypothetical protein
MSGADPAMVGTGPRRSSARAMAWALAWALVFTAAHGYWYGGGRWGLGDAPSPLPGWPRSPAGWIFTIVVVGMFGAGIAIPIVLLRCHVHGRRLRMLVALLWVGCGILVLRGASGLLDDVVRDLGLSDRGITGLTYQDTLGTADPSTGTRISTAVIDAYFLLGGWLYGWATQRQRPTRDHASSGP